MIPTITLLHHTFNPWSVRADSRVVASEREWDRLAIWDNEAKESGRRRVWVGVDVFEDWRGRMSKDDATDLAYYPPNRGMLPVYHCAEEAPANCRWATVDDFRGYLFALIDRTPNLDWLLVTERPENVLKSWPRAGFPEAGVKGTLGKYLSPANLWLGVRVSTQAEADARIPKLLEVPARVRFADVTVTEETAKIDFSEWTYTIRVEHNGDGDNQEVPCKPPLGLFILRGDTGPDARPCPIDAVLSLVRQGREAGVSVWVDIDEVPEDLRVRQLPEVGR